MLANIAIDKRFKRLKTTIRVHNEEGERDQPGRALSTLNDPYSMPHFHMQIQIE
jgi:hypothetical protein